MPEDAHGPCHWDLRKSFVKGVRATILVRGAPKWALGGAPYGARATILVRGVPKFGLGTHAGPATGTFGKAPHGIRATFSRGVCRSEAPVGLR